MISIKQLRISVIILSFMGLAFVTSATTYLSAIHGFEHNIYMIKQSLFILLGIFSIYLCQFLSIDKLKEYAPLLMFIAVVVLMLTLFPGIGHSVKGSSRWINIGISVQPSELYKVIYLFYLSVSCEYLLKNPKKIIGRIGVPYLISALIFLMQPDLGSLAIVSVMTLTYLFLVFPEFTVRRMLIAVGFLSAIIASLIKALPYRMRRVEAFMDPQSSPLTSGYQLTQSFNAISSGGLFGIGWGNSFSVRGYLPEAHTDYILSTIVEQFGIIFAVVFIVMMVTLPILLIKASLHLKTKSAKIFIQLFSILFLFEVLVNSMSATGLMPPKGLALPFISYGGSSVLGHFFMISLIIVYIKGECLLKTSYYK